MSLNSQLMTKAESTYGTPVTPDRTFPYLKGTFKPRQGRLKSEQLRATGRTKRSSPLRVYNQGGTLSVDMEVTTKGFGWWLLYLLGTLATGSATDSAYPHTGTLGSRYGDFFTCQGNFPLHPGGTAQPLTLTGCKVAKWKLSCEVDGALVLSMDIDCQSYATATSLASPSYVSPQQPYGWIDVALTIAASSVPVKSWTLDVTPGMNLDRYHQRASALKSEPTEPKLDVIMLDLEADFSSLTQHNRVRAANAASALAAVVITVSDTDTGVTIGSSTQPSLVLTMPSVSFDEIDGLEANPSDDIMQKLKCEVLYDDSANPLTMLYTSADSTA